MRSTSIRLSSAYSIKERYSSLKQRSVKSIYHVINPYRFHKKTCKSTLFSHGNIKKLHYTVLLACEQVLQGTLVAGWEKEGELATMSLEFEFCLQFPCGSVSTKLLDFCQSAQSGNEGEWKQTLKKTCKHTPRVMTSLLMSSLPISISHWLFRWRFSNSRDIVASSPSSFCPEASLGKTKSCRLLRNCQISVDQRDSIFAQKLSSLSIGWYILSLVSLMSNYSLRKER